MTSEFKEFSEKKCGKESSYKFISALVKTVADQENRITLNAFIEDCDRAITICEEFQIQPIHANMFVKENIAIKKIPVRGHMGITVTAGDSKTNRYGDQSKGGESLVRRMVSPPQIGPNNPSNQVSRFVNLGGFHSRLII